MTWDPRIILGHQQYTGPDANETMRTLSQLALSGVQQQHAQATLASMLEQQNQARALRDIYATHGADPNALMAGGFGQEAYAAQDQQRQMALQSAQEKKFLQDALAAAKKFTGEHFYEADSPEKWDAAWAAAPAEVRAQVPQQFDPKTHATLRSWAIPASTRMEQAETKRHHEAMEKRPSGMPSLAIVTGEGGVQYLANTRDPAAPAKPIVDEAGKPIAKPKAGASKSLNKGDRDALESLSGDLRTFDDLSARFKDSFAGRGVLGNVEVDAAQKLGSMAPKDSQELASFWADFASLIDLPLRNKMFGASLTPGEKASWDSAKNIKPGADPKRVKAQLEKMKSLIRTKLTTRGRSLAKDGYTAEAIEEYTGPLGMNDGAAPAARSKVINGKTYTQTADGQWEVDE